MYILTDAITPVGALLAGYLSDHYIISGQRSRPSGSWLPEDRLKAVVVPMGLIMPLSVLGYGLTTQFVGGTKGIVVNCVWLFLNGMGVSTVLNSPSFSRAPLALIRSERRCRMR